MMRWLLVAVVVTGGAPAVLLLRDASPEQQPDTWTIAFYLDGDNNLAHNHIGNLREIIAGRKNLKGVSVVVYADIGRGRMRLQPFSGVRVFEIDDRSYHKTVADPLAIALPGDGTHDPQRLRAFLALVRERYPARHHAVVVAGHGCGSFGADLELPPEHGRPFTAETLRDGLADHRPDLLVLDLCLMADTATVAALADRTDYLVVQQGRYPSKAQDYTLLLQTFAACEQRHPAAMAEAAFTSVATALRRGHPLGAAALLRTGEELDALLERVETHLADETRRSALLGMKLTRLGTFGHPFRSMVDIAAVVDHINATTSPPLELERAILRLYSKRPVWHGLSVFLPEPE